MSGKLFVQAITKFAAGVILVGVLIFLPAGTLHYFNGWLLMGSLFIPMFAAGIVMLCSNPGLLQRRLNAKEVQKDQDLVVKLSGLMFLVGSVLAGLGVRFGWYMLPRFVSCIGMALFLIAYALYAEVLRENTYLSRTIEVQEGQKVIDTGLYGIVRHPMYSVTVVLFSYYANYSGKPVCFCDISCLSPHHCKADPWGRGTAGKGTAGLSGI